MLLILHHPSVVLILNLNVFVKNSNLLAQVQAKMILYLHLSHHPPQAVVTASTSAKVAVAAASAVVAAQLRAAQSARAQAGAAKVAVGQAAAAAQAAAAQAVVAPTVAAPSALP